MLLNESKMFCDLIIAKLSKIDKGLFGILFSKSSDDWVDKDNLSENNISSSFLLTKWFLVCFLLLFLHKGLRTSFGGYFEGIKKGHFYGFKRKDFSGEVKIVVLMYSNDFVWKLIFLIQYYINKWFGSLSKFNF